MAEVGKQAAEETGGVKVIFGIIFSFNEKNITISLSDIAKVEKEGFEFRLPEPVKLGKFEELCGWLKDKFDKDIAADLKTLPSPFKEIVEKLGAMSFSIGRCHVKIPPGWLATGGDASSSETVKYTFQMEGRLPDTGIELVTGLSVDGFAFGVTNEP